MKIVPQNQQIVDMEVAIQMKDLIGIVLEEVVIILVTMIQAAPDRLVLGFYLMVHGAVM